MTPVVEEFLSILQDKSAGRIQGTVKLLIDGEEPIILDKDGARPGDIDADLTFTASEEVFREIFAGDRSPVTSVMTGALTVDGSMSRALKVSALLTE